MTKGTTPTLKFTFPFETKLLSDVLITIKDYKSEKMYTIEKTLSDCVKEDHSVSITLTEEETMKFTEHNKVKIQIKVYPLSGGVFASKIFYKYIDELLEEGVTN